VSVPNTVVGNGGPWDVVYSFGAQTMGFITRGPARRQQINNTVPRIRIGGDAAYPSDAFDALIMSGFEHGQDLERFGQGERRAQWNDGGVALHVENRITLASLVTSVDAAITPTWRRIQDFLTAANGDYIVMAEGTNLRVYSDDRSQFEDQASIGASIQHWYANDEYVFLALGSGTDAETWDGTNGGGTNTLTGIKADCFGWYQDKLYRALGNDLYEASNNDGTAYGSAIPVGWEGTDIEDLYEGFGYLLIAKPEGLYVYDGTTVYRNIDARHYHASGNFVGGHYWQGAVYLPTGSDTILKVVLNSVTSSTVSEVTPTMSGDAAKETFGHGIAKVIFGGPLKLYVGLEGGEGVYPEVLSYDGVGWQQVYRGTSGATFYAAGFSRLYNWILINDGATRRKRVRNMGRGVYPEYATSGEFWTPKLDAGYPDELKAWAKITLNVADVDADNTIGVKYRADGGAWTWMGGSQTTGTIVKSGRNELVFDVDDGEVSAYEMELAFILTRDATDSSKTPRINLPMVMRMLVTPAAVDALAETLILDLNEELRNGYGYVGSNASDAVGVNAGYTMREMLDFLDDLADTSQSVTRTDEFGRTTQVKITNKSEDVRNVDRDSSNRSMLVALNMMDTYVGQTRETAGAALEVSISVATDETVDNWLEDASGNLLTDASGNYLTEAA